MDPRIFSIFLIFSWVFMGQHPGRELYDACWYGDFDGAYDALEVPNCVFVAGHPTHVLHVLIIYGFV